MKKMTIVCLVLWSMIQQGFTAVERTPAGGRSLAMGGASVAGCDFWSVSNNQAGTAWLRDVSAGMSFENRFLLNELMFEQMGIVLPLKPGTIGLVVNRFGNNLYSELKTGLSFARKFGKHFSAGIQLDYLRIHISDDYGTRNLLSCEIGLFFQADKHLRIGLQLLNPIPVKIFENPAELLPPDICFGLSYSFSDDFLTTIEIEKDLENPLAFRAGAEYHFTGMAYARFGISASPVSFTFGAGLEFGKLKFDLASGYHQALGFSPSGSIIYSFR
jgi:hypothetical protein